MRTFTAAVILAFCSLLAVQAAPTSAGLAIRDVLGETLPTRALQVEPSKNADLEAREAKKGKKKAGAKAAAKRNDQDLAARDQIEELESTDIEGLDTREPKKKKKAGKAAAKRAMFEEVESREPKKGNKAGAAAKKAAK